MKTLLLLRHAKSSWDDISLEDHDRPLSKRGRRTAEAVASFLVAELPKVDLVLGSTARRVWETLDPMLAIMKPARIVLERKLYMARPNALLERLRRLDESMETVLVVGHNPGLHEFALALGEPSALEQLPPVTDKFPTGAFASFGIATTWRRLAPGAAKFLGYKAPRDASAPAGGKT